MDTRTTNTVPNGNSAGPPWTDEKHSHFINSMEASFVRTMLENNGGRLLRLDRQLPDTSDSTLDLNKHSRTVKNHVNAADIIGTRRRSNIDSQADKRPTRRRSSYQPYIASQDQVVPYMENKRGDKEENV